MIHNRERRGTGATIGRPPVVKIALVQVVVLTLVSCALLLLNPVLSYSVLLGGIVAVVPQLYFAAKVFRYATN